MFGFLKTKGKDPVCGMAVNASSLKSDYDGKTYFFCSNKCKTKFDANPKSYQNPAKKHSGCGCCHA